MSEKLMEGMLQLLERGGTEGAEILRMYIWLHSPLIKGLVFIFCIAAVSFFTLWVVNGWYRRAEKHISKTEKE